MENKEDEDAYAITSSLLYTFVPGWNEASCPGGVAGTSLCGRGCGLVLIEELGACT